MSGDEDDHCYQPLMIDYHQSTSFDQQISFYDLDDIAPGIISMQEKIIS